MNSPFQLLLNNGRVDDALQVAAKLSEKELRAAGAAITDEDFTEIVRLTFAKSQSIRVTSVLQVGGLLLLCLAAADRAARTALLHEMIQQLGISETKAYDSMAVFRCFAKDFYDKPKLIGQFPVESLKILSSKQASPAAREAALQLAAGRKRVSIRQAEQLVAEFAPKPTATKATPRVTLPEPEPRGRSASGSSPPRSEREVWSYCGDVVRLVLTMSDPRAADDRASVLGDLEAALDAYRHESDGIDHASAAEEPCHVR